MYRRAMRRALASVVLAGALALALPAGALDRAHWISPISIARAELGYPAAAYEILFGAPAVKTRSKLVFPDRGIVVYISKRSGRGVAVLTTNRLDVTLDGIGPCATENEFLHAYPDAPRAHGAYVLGRLHFFTKDGRVKAVVLKFPAVVGPKFDVACVDR
jgi:hypothetical protein